MRYRRRRSFRRYGRRPLRRRFRMRSRRVKRLQIGDRF